MSALHPPLTTVELPEHARRFSKAAAQYPHHARVQQRAAQHLWQWAKPALADTPAPKACVDVGCGTGTLTRLVMDSLPGVPMHAVDIAPGMLQALRDNVPSDAPLHTHLLDGETLSLEQLWIPTQSLLVSNMCAQWFNDLDAAVRRWLTVSDTLAFSVLLDDSFTVWKDAHTTCDQPCNLRRLPTRPEIDQLLNGLRSEGLAQHTALHTHEFLDQHPNGLSFARGLRAIGADVGQTGQPAQLWRVLSHLNQPCTFNYHLAFVLIQRKPATQS